MSTKVTKPRGIWLTALTLDVRFMIYDLLIAPEHNITLGKIADRGPLAPLITVLPSLEKEIINWSKKSCCQRNLVRTRLIGIYDPKMTVFHLCLTKERVKLFRGNHESLTPRIQRLCLLMESLKDKEFLKSDLFDCQMFGNPFSSRRRVPLWPALEEVKVIVPDQMCFQIRWITAFFNGFQSARGMKNNRSREFNLVIISYTGRKFFDRKIGVSKRISL